MCEICNGHPNCPVCGEELEMIDCPECDGAGEILAEDGEMCECEKCAGHGEIEAPQYEADPDEKHDNRY